LSPRPQPNKTKRNPTRNSLLLSLHNSVVRHEKALRQGVWSLICAFVAYGIVLLMIWVLGNAVGVPVAIVVLLFLYWLVGRIAKQGFYGAASAIFGFDGKAAGTWNMPSDETKLPIAAQRTGEASAPSGLRRLFRKSSSGNRTHPSSGPGSGQ